MKNATYDFLKKYVITILPALGVLYAGLSKLWGFPHVTEICGTIALIETFLTSILNVSSNKYWKDTND